MDEAAPGWSGGDTSAPGGESLRRQLRARGIWALAINGVIGAGIFATPGFVAAEVGPYSPHVFVLCGLLLAPVALCFAEVASGFASTGGPVRYVEAAFGPFASFQTGWTFYVARVSSTAANVSLLVATLAWFWPPADRGLLRVALLALVCGALTLVNVVGTRHAMRSIGALTLLKLLPLLALVAFGLPGVDAGTLIPREPLPSAGRLATAVTFAIYAFVGWETALVPAGESRDPARDMPRGLLWALGTASLLYVALQVVSVAALPDLAHTAERPLVALGAVLFGPAGAAILTLGVIASVGGNLAQATLSTPRITYAMARAGVLPPSLGRVHPTYRTPAVSVLVCGVLVFVLAATGTFVELAKISVLTRLLIYLAVILSVPRLRSRPAEVPGRLRLPGGPAVPALAALVCLGLASQVDWPTVWRTAFYLGLGTLLYLASRRGAAPSSAVSR
jgi:amino acid transporter